MACWKEFKRSNMTMMRAIRWKNNGMLGNLDMEYSNSDSDPLRQLQLEIGKILPTLSYTTVFPSEYYKRILV